MARPQLATLEEEEAEFLDAMRKAPLKDERSILWAVQDGDDTNSRQPLPEWLAMPVARAVSLWAKENRKWQEKIELRTQQGKSLPPAAQKKYDAFVNECSTARLLFSKKNRRQVLKLNADKQLLKKRAELFLVEISMSVDPSKLEITAGDGVSKRFCLVQGEPTSAEDVPDFLLSGGVSEEALAAIAAQHNDDEEQGEDQQQEKDEQHDEQPGHHDEGHEQEQAHLEAMDKEISDDGSEGQEILCYTSEEEMLTGIVQDKFQKVKDFMNRPEWKALEARDATKIPPSSFIGYHKSTRTWQGFWEGQSAGLSLTHGGTTNRSPGEALLGVILGLVQRHCKKFPRDAVSWICSKWFAFSIVYIYI